MADVVQQRSRFSTRHFCTRYYLGHRLEARTKWDENRFVDLGTHVPLGLSVSVVLCTLLNVRLRVFKTCYAYVMWCHVGRRRTSSCAYDMNPKLSTKHVAESWKRGAYEASAKHEGPSPSAAPSLFTVLLPSYGAACDKWRWWNGT